ncbi:MAG: hypothetical protein ACRERD_26870 [Candidatus Binatia bacterium]
MRVYTSNIKESPRLSVAEPHSSLLTMLEQLHYQQGEKRLMLAVLKDAVACIERYHSARGVHSWSAFRAALGWVLSHDRTWPFSFENICLALDLDPVRLRSALYTPLLPLATAIHAGKSPPKV